MAAVLPKDLRREVEQAIAANSRMTVLTHATATDRSALGRVVLVGDAAGSCHPLTATGMTMCIADALLLQKALRERSDHRPGALDPYHPPPPRPPATRP